MSDFETDTARECLITQVLSARTLPEIAEAARVLRDWLEEHPEEPGMADGFEQLAMMQESAERQEAERIAKEPAKAPVQVWIG